MLNQQTVEKLYAMRLNAMAEAFTEQMNSPEFAELSFAERFGLLVDRQWTWKEDRRMKRLLKNARLKINACVEDIDYRSPRGLDRSVMMNLISCDWIRKQQNVIITGATGVGKTFIACALANKACREGFSVLYARAPRFYYDLAIAKADGSYPKLFSRLAKTQLLVLDDLGVSPMTDSERRNLLEVIEDRNGSGSTLVASQLPIEKWFEIIGEPTIADAILDRLVHNAHKINLKGESMRKKHSSLTQNKDCVKN
jgi:DNA replication protein DnaC